jgi:hypothetical protein
MTKIYVRVPRNHWTSIGEIDLDGYQAVYQGRKGGPVSLDEEILSAIKKATELTRQIRAYEVKCGFLLLHQDLSRFEKHLWADPVIRHARHLRKLIQKRDAVGPRRLLAERARSKSLRSRSAG